MDIPFPQSMMHPRDSIVLFRDIREAALDILEFSRSDPNADVLANYCGKTFSKFNYMSELLHVKWIDDNSLRLMISEVSYEPLNSKRYHSIFKSWDIGFAQDFAGLKIAMNLMMLTLDQYMDYVPKVAKAAEALNVNLSERAELPNISFMMQNQEDLEGSLRQIKMQENGWSLDLGIIERRALSNDTIKENFLDDDAVINETIRGLEALPHDVWDRKNIKVLKEKHTLSGSCPNEKILITVTPTISGIDFSGYNNKFNIINDAIIVHQCIPLTVLEIMVGKRLEDVIDHPLFKNTDILITRTSINVSNEYSFLCHDGAKTKREVPIESDNVEKMWDQAFER